MKAPVKKALSKILKAESKLVLLKYKPKVIAITGSVGKTSTKDAVYAVLSKMSYVRKSEKSFNSEIGLPLTILGVPNGWNNPFTWISNILRGLGLIIFPNKYPKWLVLEVGVGKPGDMRETASWLKTDAVIMTAIGDPPPHIEFFESRKHLVEEKMELIKTLKKDGLLVLNADDETVSKMREGARHRVVTYGFSKEADVMVGGDNIAYNRKGEPKGIVFRVDAGGKSLPVTIEGVFGKNHIYASLAALALSFGMKWNMVAAVDSLRQYDVPPGRMRLLFGIKDSLIIDDTYNSSPMACEIALKTLGQINCKIDNCRKVAVLGDMLELGKHTRDAHFDIGKMAKENCDLLIVVGVRARAIKEGALAAGMSPEQICELENSYEAGKFMNKFIQKGDTILIKGSQGMRMERTVEAILLDKENKYNLLVRQEPEWLEKP